MNTPGPIVSAHWPIDDITGIADPHPRPEPRNETLRGEGVIAHDRDMATCEDWFIAIMALPDDYRHMSCTWSPGTISHDGLMPWPMTMAELATYVARNQPEGPSRPVGPVVIMPRTR